VDALTSPPPLPRISVVTPSFNQAAFLEETLRSVLEQDYPRIEYLVIDGGSTDGSVEILRRYESRLAYWVSERDKGQSDAINKGWARATGEIVAYLNSDDTYEPGALRVVGEYFARHPETGMVFGHCNQMDEHGRRVGVLRANPFALKQLLYTNVIMQPTVFLRKTVLDDVGMLDADMGFAMDYDLWLRVALRHRIDALPAALANFRAHRASKSFAQPYGFVRDMQTALARAFEHPNMPRELLPLRTQALTNMYLVTLLLCFALGQPEQGRALWDEMMAFNPHCFADADAIVEMVANNAVHMVETPWLHDARQDPIQWLREFLRALPANAEPLCRLEARITSRIYTIRAFEAYGQNDYAGARENVTRAWRAERHALKNRGLLSIWLETLLGANTMRRWRQRRAAHKTPA
jgi:hypothetical protein